MSRYSEMTPEEKEKKRVANNAWRARNKDKVRAYGVKYYHADPEKSRKKNKEQHAKHAVKRRASAAKWAKDNPERARRNRLRASRRNAGVDPLAAEALLAKHDGRCDCCGVTAPGGRWGWNVDHDHATGRLRGILCHNCNTAIGKLGDTLEGVLKAVRYLERQPQPSQGDKHG